ncbi:hypothetical protein TWF730_004191 [Orbilia blumenaviensis]|uniref:Uncharacterized protein n=1 Tax=Orbilia blumenaviensis TaxID=1796055 RepID=A0AAV9U0F4_9PEZI
MFSGNPFKAIEIAEDDDSSGGSAPDTVVGISREKKPTVPTAPPVKTSRFSNLFQKNLAAAEASISALNLNEEIQNEDPVPRYKVPRNGQGSKMNPASPPRAPGDVYPKRLFVDNIPYASGKKDVMNFFDGFKVESITWQKKSGMVSGHNGAAYVIVGSEEEAKSAVAQLNGTPLRGRIVKVVRSKVSNGGNRKSQPDFSAFARQQSKQNGTQQKTQTVEPVSCNEGPLGLMSDGTSTLRKSIFDLACNTICTKGRTPDEIFQEINFNEEEKVMIRDFYLRYKQAKRGAPDLFSPFPLDAINLPCLKHGFTQCVSCQQALLLEKIHDEEEQKENALARSMHNHSLSWDSTASHHGNHIQPLHRSNTLAATAQALVTGPAAYPNLSAGAALRLYGPKFVRENYPQQEPPIHNTSGQVSRGYANGNPYLRQHAIVSTQPGVKTHCAYFLRTGRCDFAQQGCKFSHELPPGGHAELALPNSRRTVSSPPHFFSRRNSGQFGGPIFTDATQRLTPLPDIDLIEDIAPTRAMGPVAHTRNNRLTDGEFSLVPRGGRATQPVLNRFQPFEENGVVSARRRLATQPAQRRDSRQWREHGPNQGREQSALKENSKRKPDHPSETDGAADDEGSSEDLISLSSFGH